MKRCTTDPRLDDAATVWGESAAWGEGGPTFFDLARAITIDKVHRLDERRRRRLDERVRRWAARHPPRPGARVADRQTRAGDRFVAMLTACGARSVRALADDQGEQQSLFCEGLNQGLDRLVKYWGPGRRYPQRCPVRYAYDAAKSGWSNALRRWRRELAGTGAVLVES